eukprot:4030900-Pyramimonas_sp.AAC.1
MFRTGNAWARPHRGAEADRRRRAAQGAAGLRAAGRPPPRRAQGRCGVHRGPAPPFGTVQRGAER